MSLSGAYVKKQCKTVSKAFGNLLSNNKNQTMIIKLLNFIQDGPFWGCSWIWGRGGKKPLFPKIYHTYPTSMKLRTVVPKYVKSKKYINHVVDPLSSADNSRTRLHFNT